MCRNHSHMVGHLAGLIEPTPRPHFVLTLDQDLIVEVWTGAKLILPKHTTLYLPASVLAGLPASDLVAMGVPTAQLLSSPDANLDLSTIIGPTGSKSG